MTADHPRHGWKETAKAIASRVNECAAHVVGHAAYFAGGAAPVVIYSSLDRYTRPRVVDTMLMSATATCTSLASYAAVYNYTQSPDRVAVYAATMLAVSVAGMVLSKECSASHNQRPTDTGTGTPNHPHLTS